MNLYNTYTDEELEKACNVGPGFIGTTIRTTRVKGLVRMIIDTDAKEEERLANRNKLIYLLKMKDKDKDKDKDKEILAQNARI